MVSKNVRAGAGVRLHLRLRAPGAMFHWNISNKFAANSLPYLPQKCEPLHAAITEMDQCQDETAGTPLFFSEVSDELDQTISYVIETSVKFRLHEWPLSFAKFIFG